MHAEARHRHSVREYLDLDEHVDVRLEYWQGEIVAMAGGSPRHVRICANFMRVLGVALDGSPCEPLGTDQRVMVAEDLYVYPDVTVACEPVWRDHALTNPRVVIEVLSESTADVDRGRKVPAYRGLSTVSDIVLVRQDRIEVELWHRGPNGWSMVTLCEGDHLDIVDVKIPLAELYKRVLDD